ncbi:MAG TPA: DHHA1 domain-containing protein, partial [Oscillospiraceae bacterium]|nr:DHHA1 domain-containing protein [Oscillospiraceae bacterium]
TTEDENRAAELAATLCEQNSRRQQLEQQISGDVEKMFTERPELFQDRVIVLDGGGWHHGVIGIVCSKVVERTGKPCVLISRDGEEARGSARSVEGFSMIDAVSYASDCLTRYGGHPFAAGMSLESSKIDAFRRKINEFAAKNFSMMPVFTLKIDKILDPADVTVEKIAALHLLEPFGCKNEMPLFAFRKVIIDGIYAIGNGKHIRLRLKKAGLTFYAVWFGVSQEDFPYKVGETVDIAASCDVGDYNGEARVSVKIRDVRPSSLCQERLFGGNLAYDGFRRGEPVPEEEIPARPDFALVYRFIREDGGFQGEPDILFGRITGANRDTTMSSCKMRLCIDVMEELGLVASSYDGRRIRVT